MPRSTPEWIGKNDDTAVPPRVRARQFIRDKGCCRKCGRKINAGDTWETDHIVAVINGGANAESNLQTLCGWCHRGKTGEDVAEKAKAARKFQKHYGIKKRKGPPMPGSRDSRFKRRMDGTVERRT